MKRHAYLSVFTTIMLSGCATYESACEDVTLVSEQVQACQLL